MPFFTSEIRWFSVSGGLLKKIYTNFEPIGAGIEEAVRTDYYLYAQTTDTGIKVREGNLELKLRTGDDLDLGYGIIQDWVKWSHPCQKSMIATIAEANLKGWVAIQKKRLKKDYAFEENRFSFNDLGPTGRTGCAIECTELIFEGENKSIYSLGFEAYGSDYNPRDLLIEFLERNNIETFPLDKMNSLSYPELIINATEKL